MSDGKGTPLLSDRSAWDTVNFPEKHGKDISEGTPLVHLPVAENEGDIPRWDGTKWVTIPNSDIVTVGDSSTVALDITDQVLTADVIPSGIKLDDFGTPDDNSDLNSSEFNHGLLRKLSGISTDFLNGLGEWATPEGSGSSGSGGSSENMICVLRTTNSQNISSGADVPLSYETSEELLDVKGMHDGTNKTRINILEDGVYELHGIAEFVGGSASTRYVYFGKTSGGVRTEIGDAFSSGVSQFGATAFCVIPLVAGDFIEFLVYHTSGSGVSISRSSLLIRKLSYGSGYTEGARVYNSSSQTLVSGEDTAIVFDAEDYDTNAIHDNSTNNTRLTCKTAGKYQVSGMLVYANSSTGYRLAYIRMTRGSTVTYQALSNMPAINGDATFVNISSIIELQVDDYLELVGRHTQGSNCSVTGGGSANGGSYLAMQRIG